MKNLFISFALLLGLLFAGIAATTPTQTLPISQMPITTNISSNAYFPLIQPRTGQVTNDNFRATRATILRGIDTLTATNIYVTNLYASNFFTTNFYAIQTNNYFTNIYVETAIITNLYVTNGPITINGSNVAIINPTDNYIPYRVNTNTFGDSSLQVTGGSVVEGATFGAINIQATNELSTKGAFMTKSVSSVTLAGGTNVVTTVNKGLIFIANLTGNTNKVVQLSSGNGIGQHVWIVNADTNQWFMPQEALSDDSSKTNFIRGGVWAPSELGETIELMEIANGWVEIGRSNPNGGPPVVVNSELWTNSAGLLRPSDLNLPVAALELNASNTLSTDGSFLTRAVQATVLAPGTNTINPFNTSYFVLASTATNGVYVNLESGNGSGQHVWILNYWTNASFTIQSGPLADDTNAVIVIRGGSWTPTEAGESIELLGTPNGWAEINRSNPNGTAPGTINPTDGRLPVRASATSFQDSPIRILSPSLQDIVIDDALYFNSSDVAIFSGSGSPEGVQSAKVASLFMRTNGVSGTTLYTKTNGTGNTGWSPLVDAGSLLWTNNAGVLEPIDLTLPLRWTNKVTLGVDGSVAIVFGPGTTNVLYRSGNDLVYTNGAADVKLLALNSSAKGIALEAQSSSSVGIASSGSPASLFIRNAADSVSLASSIFAPTTDISIALGNVSGPRWSGGAFGGNLYVSGYLGSPVTNYSRLSVSHGGTNDAVVFDSQSAGTAGVPRPFDFYMGGTNALRIANDIGAWPNDATKYFDGSGHWSVPAGGGGVNYWTNLSGVIQPIDLTLQPMVTNGWAIGANTLTYWGGWLTNGESLVSERDVDAGEPDYNEIWVGAHDASNNGHISIKGKTSGGEFSIARSYGGTNNITFIDSRHLTMTRDSSKVFSVDSFGEFAQPAGLYYNRDTNSAPGADFKLFGLDLGTTNKFAVIQDGAITTGGGTNRWIFKGVAVTGGQTNATAEINGTNYSWIVF